MQETQEGVKFIGHGGSGGEASVNIELRTVFPGIGGKIITQQAAVVALREEYKLEPKLGHKMFLKHAIIKKLEDYFHRKGLYQFSHIPRPFGSISGNGETSYEAYIYEWVFGTDGFPWEHTNPEGGSFFVKLIDWREFGSAFCGAGINLITDCTCADDGRCSQNVIHQMADIPGNPDDLVMNPLWKRIDFGRSSIKIDYEKLAKFLRDEKEGLRQILRAERYDMMTLALEYLIDFKGMDRLDIGRLDALAGSYRVATLSHYISRGTSVSETGLLASLGSREQSLV